LRRENGPALTEQLQQENEGLSEKAAKYDKHLEQSRDSYYRNKEADIEAWRERQRVRQAEYRARKKRKAASKEGQPKKLTNLPANFASFSSFFIILRLVLYISPPSIILCGLLQDTEFFDSLLVSHYIL
jgi:hypothetical protein